MSECKQCDGLVEVLGDVLRAACPMVEKCIDDVQLYSCDHEDDCTCRWESECLGARDRFTRARSLLKDMTDGGSTVVEEGKEGPGRSRVAGPFRVALPIFPRCKNADIHYLL